VLDYTSKHYEAGDKGDGKVLRRRMVQAGIYNPQAVAMFFVARTVLAVGLAVAAFVGLPLVVEPSSIQWLAVMAAGLLGYVAPSVYLDRRISARPTSTVRAFRISDSGGVRGFRLSMEVHWSGSGANPRILSMLCANRTWRTSRSALAAPRRKRPITWAIGWGRGGALIRHLDPAICRTRFQHHRRRAFIPTTCGTRGLARRGEGLRPAGQAHDPDDAVHLSGAVRGHPAAGHCPAFGWALLIPFAAVLEVTGTI
jgi:hypothetical protein